METELLYGCPSPRLTVGRRREALRAQEAATTPVTCRTVDNPGDAERLGFRGSPTIPAGRRDQSARPGYPVAPCRLYSDARGGHRSPAVQQIQAVLTDAG